MCFHPTACLHKVLPVVLKNHNLCMPQVKGTLVKEGLTAHFPLDARQRESDAVTEHVFGAGGEVVDPTKVD